MAEVPISAGRRAVSRRQAPSQCAVAGLGVTSREGAVRTGPAFERQALGVSPQP